MLISPPPRLTHKLIAVCAVAFVVAGSWAKQSAIIHLKQIDHFNSIVTTGVDAYPIDNSVIEFDRLITPEIIPAARIRNSPGTLRLMWSNSLLPAFSGYVKVHEARFRYLKKVPNGQHFFVDVPVISNSTPIPVIMGPNSTSAQIEIPLGDLPNFVVGGNLQLRVELRGNIGIQLPGEPDSLAWGNKDVWNDFGTIYLTAQQPVDIQVKPWIEVLEQACWFAQEMATESDVRREITKGIYYETKTYSGYGRFFTEDVSGDDQRILLTDYFSPGIAEMDCRDGASLTVVMSESLGFPTYVLFYYEEMTETNPICPAGSDSSDFSAYKSVLFNFHAVAFAVPSSVYDSVTALWMDLGGNAWQNPVWDWQWSTYPQVAVPTTPTPPTPPPPAPLPKFYGMVHEPEDYDIQNKGFYDVVELK